MIETDQKYLKSCLNYTGGKHKLLKQILPLFPQRIHHFVDLFCGGLNVAINVNASGTIQGIDKQAEVLRLFHTLKTMSEEEVLATISTIINRYGFTNTTEHGYSAYGCASGDGLAAYNKEPYLKLREDYNHRLEDNAYYDLVFYVLIVFGFNNQIRFNQKGGFNIPVGKRDFNDQIQHHLRQFMHVIKKKDIQFSCRDFREVDFALTSRDFLYADPPYFISTATYNEQNGWTEKEERALLDLLDQLNDQGVPFALSNVLEHKGAENTLLKHWATKYEVHDLHYHYRNANYQIKQKSSKTREVLITNYAL